MKTHTLLVGLSMALVATVAPPAALAAGKPWFERSLVGMEIGPTGAQFGYSDPNDSRYCARFDGRDIVRRCVAAHCEYVVLWARDGDYAYYDSRLLPKAPGLGARDPLREGVDEAKRCKIPLIAYCVVQQGGNFLEAHPEWKMRGADGKPIGRYCLNSGYLEAMKQIVAEQLAYGIDGFHIDMLDQGFGPPYGCWCASCRTLFEKQFGKPMPRGVAWDEDWDSMLEFRYQSSCRFEQALCAHIKALNPQATVDFNYHGNPPFSWEVGQLPVRHAGNADFVTGETGMWGFSALTVGLNAEFYRAATPGQPVQVAISRDARMYHNQTVRPLADLCWELFTLLAHGAFVTTVDKTAFDGGLDPLAYERIGGAQAAALARRAHFGQPPVAEVGLYFSSRTRDWFAREKPEDYFQGFRGAHKAMVYEHIPWGVILDENVTLETLQQFPIVMLPNVAILSESEVGQLRRYVSDGGKLIVTGLSGCCDRRGKLQGKSSLESLTGARFVQKPDSLDNWVRFPGSQTSKLQTQLLPEGQQDRPLLVKGPAVIYETTSATAGELMKPYRTVRQQQGKEGTGWPMSAEAAVGPAILLHPMGKGAVLTFAGSPDFATASEHHVIETRRLLRNAIRLLNPQPRIQITAPTTVETVVTDDPASRTLRVHFIAYNAPPQTTPAQHRPYVLPALIEEAPLYRAAVTLRDNLKNAKAWNASTQLQRRANRVDLTIGEIHEVVALKY
jgi:Hypothetical glycosyl hydrolase 6/Beta-galactosidase trimerisation domain